MELPSVQDGDAALLGVGAVQPLSAHVKTGGSRVPREQLKELTFGSYPLLHCVVQLLPLCMVLTVHAESEFAIPVGAEQGSALHTKLLVKSPL